MIASGVTTVQHLHGRTPRKARPGGSRRRRGDPRLPGRRDARLLFVRACATRTGSSTSATRISSPACRPSCAARCSAGSSAFKLTLDDDIALFEGLYGRYQQQAPGQGSARSGQPALVLRRGADAARRLLAQIRCAACTCTCSRPPTRRNTPAGAAAAPQWSTSTASACSGRSMTLGHGVWLNESDIERLAETGTCVCHNCSSNFRLRSGVAALNQLRGGRHQHRDRHRRGRHQRRPRHAAGDAAGAARASRARHGRRRADACAGVPHGDRRAAPRRPPFGAYIGALEVGRAADIVLIDWAQITYPYLDAETPLLDAVLQRAKTDGVRSP